MATLFFGGYWELANNCVANANGLPVVTLVLVGLRIFTRSSNTALWGIILKVVGGPPLKSARASFVVLTLVALKYFLGQICVNSDLQKFCCSFFRRGDSSCIRHNRHFANCFYSTRINADVVSTISGCMRSHLICSYLLLIESEVCWSGIGWPERSYFICSYLVLNQCANFVYQQLTIIGWPDADEVADIITLEPALSHWLITYLTVTISLNFCIVLFICHHKIKMPMLLKVFLGSLKVLPSKCCYNFTMWSLETTHRYLGMS